MARPQPDHAGSTVAFDETGSRTYTVWVGTPAPRRRGAGHELTVSTRPAPLGRRGPGDRGGRRAGLPRHPPRPAASAAACPGSAGVTVVVEYGALGGGTDTGCAAEGGGQTADAAAEGHRPRADVRPALPGLRLPHRRAARRRPVREHPARRRLLGSVVVGREDGGVELLLAGRGIPRRSRRAGTSPWSGTAPPARSGRRPTRRPTRPRRRRPRPTPTPTKKPSPTPTATPTPSPSATPSASSSPASPSGPTASPSRTKKPKPTPSPPLRDDERAHLRSTRRRADRGGWSRRGPRGPFRHDRGGRRRWAPGLGRPGGGRRAPRRRRRGRPRPTEAAAVNPALTWLPRDLHPVAWWGWAIGLAVVASCTTNIWMLLLVIGVAALVVAARRGDHPWSGSFRIYVALAAVIVVTRVVFRILFGGGNIGPGRARPARRTAARLGPRRPPPRPGHPRVAAVRAVRRAPARDDRDLRRRGQQPGEPQAPAALDAGGALRGRDGPGRRDHDPAAAGRQPAPRARRPATAGWRHPSRRRPAAPGRPRPRGRPRAVARPRGGDGRARLRPRRRPDARPPPVRPAR